ncbi:MAG: lytic transglycosylase domain-containing protein [Candidatus Margulisbacteria bacterium]|nr:lytic transglycosylase domain-containing protein [Candidatus Margulisiibacteriota bacterium]
MEATTAVVVFIFVISILTSLGDKDHSNNQPSSPPGVVYNNVSAPPIDPVNDGVDDGERAAIQKFISKYRKPDEAAMIAESIVRNSNEKNVNPKLITALMSRESRFNPKAVSSSGAIGLGQLLPSTAKGLKLDDPFDIEQNTHGTVLYIKSLLQRFGNDATKALAGYFEGPNAITRNGGFSAKTKAYVEDILNVAKKI